MSGPNRLEPKGPWTADQCGDFLSGARVPIRLACNGASGTPVLASLWFTPLEGRLWCATQRDARVARLLEADPRCAFEAADERPPYRGVRGQGDAALQPERGREILELLIDRYLDDPRSDFAKWLRSRADRETAIAIAPRSLLTWDFRERMVD